MTTIRLPKWPWRVVQELGIRRGVSVWLVGGAVRDLLLDRPLHDWDFAVDRDAMALARASADALGGFFFPLDEERGTGRVVLETRDGPRLELDFARLRGSSLAADLAGRDFTINAMALDSSRRLVDPLGGRRDLQLGLVRATHRRVFEEDPVRLLRAVRLEAELAFDIELRTEQWVCDDAALLVQPAAERVRDELARSLMVPGVSGLVRRLQGLGLLPHVLPELTPLQGVPQPRPHRFDVWEHSLHAADAVDGVFAALTGVALPAGSRTLKDVPEAAWGELTRRLGEFSRPLREHLAVDVADRRDRLLLLRLGALLHDVGKPHTQSEDDGAGHFCGHELEGARRAASRMRALRFSRDEVRRVRTMIEAHLRPALLAGRENLTGRLVYRYFRATGDAGVETTLLSLADYLARWGPDLPKEGWAERLGVVEVLLFHYFEQPDRSVNPQLPIDGHDLMHALDLCPGPEIGKLLELIREAVAAGEVKTQEEALELAREAA